MAYGRSSQTCKHADIKARVLRRSRGCVGLLCIALACCSESGEEGQTGGGGAGGAAPETSPFGFMPTTITSAHADAAYAHWKENWLVSCPDGAYRVEWDTENQTVSEGIAYGMLLAVGNDDREVFDGLWQYYTNNLDPNGLMHWRREGCEGEDPGDSSNAASDADLDSAMALVMAECRWGSEYASDATDLIGRILEHETVVYDGMVLLQPGDMFGGPGCLNASYFAPAYYRAFASRDATTPEEAERWTRLADDSYTLLDRMAHETTGLVPNWSDAEGEVYEEGPPGCDWYDEPHIYGSDAVRTPWRISTDYLWWGTAEAKPWLGKVTRWVKDVGITEVLRRYELDGTVVDPQHHSVISVGAFAAGAMSFDQETVDEFTAHALEIEEDTSYFADSLRALYFLQLSGRFTPCGGD